MSASRVWLVALLAIAACTSASQPTDVLSLTSCGDGHVDDGEDCDDGNAVSGDGCSSTCRDENTAGLPLLHVEWLVTMLAGGPVTCSPGATASVHVDPEAQGSAVVRSFPCEARVADIPIKAGDYEVRVDILDGDGDVEIGSLPHAVTVDTTNGSVTVPMFVDAGYFTAQWKILSSGPVTCTDAGVAEVDLVAIDTDGDSHRTMLDCNDGNGISEPLLAGSYMVHLEALDVLNKLVGMSSVSLKSVAGNNAIFDLNEMDISVP